MECAEQMPAGRMCPIVTQEEAETDNSVLGRVFQAFGSITTSESGSRYVTVMNAAGRRTGQMSVHVVVNGDTATVIVFFHNDRNLQTPWSIRATAAHGVPECAWTGRAGVRYTVARGQQILLCVDHAERMPLNISSFTHATAAEVHQMFARGDRTSSLVSV